MDRTDTAADLAPRIRTALAENRLVAIDLPLDGPDAGDFVLAIDQGFGPLDTDEVSAPVVVLGHDLDAAAALDEALYAAHEGEATVEAVEGTAEGTLRVTIDGETFLVVARR